MADSGVSDIKKLLGDVLDKLTSVETKLTAVHHELSTVKLDQQRLHDAVNAEKRSAFPTEQELAVIFTADLPVFPTVQELAVTFTAGLRHPQLRAAVEQRRPSTLEEAMRLALALEPVVNSENRPAFPTEQELAVIFTAGLRDPQLRAAVEQRRPATLEEAGRLAIALEHAVNTENRPAFPTEQELAIISAAGLPAFPTEQELVVTFIAGLRDPQLRAAVEQRRPATLEEAMRLALALQPVANAQNRPACLTEQELAVIFTAGLRDPQLRAAVEQRRPATVEEAGRLALALEHLYN